MLHKGDGDGIMTDKELHKLSRRDLLQLLLEQGRELEETKRQLAETEEILQRLEENYERLRKRLDKKDEQIHKLRDMLQSERTKRKIELSEAGSIAEAALRLNVIFEAAQKAADQYLYNIKLLNGGEGQEADLCEEDFLDEPDESEDIEIRELGAVGAGEETAGTDGSRAAGEERAWNGGEEEDLDAQQGDLPDAEPDEWEEENGLQEEEDGRAERIDWTDRIDWSNQEEPWPLESMPGAESPPDAQEALTDEALEEESLTEEALEEEPPAEEQEPPVESRVQESSRKLLRRQLIGRKTSGKGQNKGKRI